MKTYIVDLSGWGLVGIAAGLGAYACYIFSTSLSKPLAAGITGVIIAMF